MLEEAKHLVKEEKEEKEEKRSLDQWKNFYEHFHYLTNRIILNNKRQEDCDKKKCEEENLSHLS